MEVEATAAVEETRTAEEERARAEGQLSMLTELSRQLDRLCEKTLDELHQQRQQFENSLRAKLHREVQAYARHASSSVLEQLQKDPSARGMRYDTAPLRQRLAEIFIRDYRLARRHVVDRQRIIALQIRQILTEAVPEIDVELDWSQTAASFVYPPLSPLGQPLVFDLEQSWWRQWWNRRKNAAETATTLEGLIRKEYMPVADQLVAAAQHDLGEEIANAEWKIAVTSNRVGRTIEDRSRELHLISEERHKLLIETGDSATVAASNAETIEQLRQKRDRCFGLAQELAAIADRCRIMVESPD
jgi:hypothetical protein